MERAGQHGQESQGAGALNIGPYGSWRSPIGSAQIAAGTIGLGAIALDGDVYWLETRPAEQGRHVVVRRTPDGRSGDVLAAPWSARTRVHEYGGGSYAVHGGALYFANFADQRLYAQRGGEAPRPLTQGGTELRYADLAVDARRQRIVCVREDHRGGGREPENTVVAVPLDGGEPRVLASGHDFYAAPRLAPDGRALAWLAWRHPNMPWDGTELWLAQLREDGSLADARVVAGGADEAIVQPEWSPDGVLHFASDRSGWWNLYRWRAGGAEALCPMQAEFSGPHWSFGISQYAFESARRIVCAFRRAGAAQLGLLDLESGALEELGAQYTHIDGVRAAPGCAVFEAGSTSEPTRLVRLDLASRRVETLRSTSSLSLPAGDLSAPRSIEFPTEHGRTAHAFFYPPRNAQWCAPPGERPPLLVLSHGGPTASTSASLRLGIQFWTSRGIAVVDVNYGGSSGYGRAYRQRLDGQWGVVDVDDCVNAARYLVEKGEADGRRLAIRGGSAGGYTTLCALAFRDVFHVGASHYGVSDLIALDRDTHKFESRYTARLVGPYPERRDLYLARSPIEHVERLRTPVIFLQGLEDRVVPPDQSEKMAAALRAKGIPVAYVGFAGEQHGFRQAANIARALDAELYFYSRVLGFALADPVEPVAIDNLPAPAPA